MKRSVDMTDDMIFSSNRSNSIDDFRNKIVNRVAWDSSKGRYNLTKHRKEHELQYDYATDYNIYFFNANNTTSSTVSISQNQDTIMYHDFDTYMHPALDFTNTRSQALYYTFQSIDTDTPYIYEKSIGLMNDTKHVTVDFSKTCAEIHDQRFIGEYINFPTGNVKDILKSRIRGSKFYSSSVEKQNKIRVCDYCSKHFRKLPYLKGVVGESICEKCYTKSKHKDFINDVKIGKTWMTKQYTRLNFMHSHSHLNSFYLHYKPWDLYDSQETFKDRLMKKNVIIKKKGMTVRWRQNPWQPAGRKEQFYDKVFDDLTWRKSLEMRLLQDNSLLSERQ